MIQQCLTPVVIDGAWGSIPAGSAQADSARYIDENALIYERMIPKTNYGETVGTDYVSTLSLFPQFNGATASYSYGNLPDLTNRYLNNVFNSWG